MARKITMFELHFDGAHFGPSLGGAVEEPVDEYLEQMDVEESPTEANARRRGPALLGLVAVVSIGAIARLAVRRLRTDDDDLEIEITAESDEESLESQA